MGNELTFLGLFLVQTTLQSALVNAYLQSHTKFNITKQQHLFLSHLAPHASQSCKEDTHLP